LAEEPVVNIDTTVSVVKTFCIPRQRHVDPLV